MNVRREQWTGRSYRCAIGPGGQVVPPRNRALHPARHRDRRSPAPARHGTRAIIRAWTWIERAAACSPARAASRTRPGRRVSTRRARARADLLGAYADRLNACELNNTFYQQPTAPKVAAWLAATPEDFRFSVKAQRGGSWRSMAGHAAESVPWLTQPYRLFGERLGTVLFRVPDTTEAGRRRARPAVGGMAAGHAADHGVPARVVAGRRDAGTADGRGRGAVRDRPGRAGDRPTCG